MRHDRRQMNIDYKLGKLCDWIQEADEKHYRAGWVGHRYRYRFKSWPDDEMIEESLLLSDLPEKECDAFKKNLKLAKR
jgi:hypothetical protein